MIKKILYGFALVFIFAASTSATLKENNKLNDTISNSTKMSLTWTGVGTIGTEGSAGESITNLIDGTNNKWCSYTSDGKFSAVFESSNITTLDKYVIKTANATSAVPNRNWKDWKIYGGLSASSSSWTKLVDHSGSDLPTTDYTSTTFDVTNNTESFKFFKIEFSCSGIESSKSLYLQQMSELELYGVPETKMSLTYTGVANTGTIPTGQGPDKLVDGVINNNEDKWCSYFTQDTMPTFYAVYKSNASLVLSKYVLRTGGDTSSVPCRNWDDWKIYGGNSSNGPWVTLVDHQNDTTLQAVNSTPYLFSDVTDKTEAYEYFKVEFDVKEKQPESNMYIHQMELMELYGVHKYNITYMDGDTTLTGLTPNYYLEGVGADTLATPTEVSGKTFLGWYDANEGGNVVTSISNNETGDKTLYGKWLSIPSGNALGGYYNKGDSKQQVVMFGFTYGDYANLSDGDTFGIYIYSSSSGGTPSKTFTGTDITSLKAKEGRFYCVYDCETEGATYYAKSFVITGGDTSYSSMLSATGNYETEYKL